MGSRRASKSGLNLAMRIIMAYFGFVLGDPVRHHPDCHDDIERSEDGIKELRPPHPERHVARERQPVSQRRAPGGEV